MNNLKAFSSILQDKPHDWMKLARCYQYKPPKNWEMWPTIRHTDLPNKYCRIPRNDNKNREAGEGEPINLDI